MSSEGSANRELVKGEVRNGTAVVIGGSIAGTMCARVLSDHFERVIVIERDDLPTTAQPRKGVPHAEQIHTLLAFGRRVMEELYPGFTAETERSGAVLAGLTENVMSKRRYGWAPRFKSDLQILFISRALIEHVIRERTRACPRIEYRAGTVVGLTPGDRDGWVGGVRVESEDREVPDVVTADVVVDASGRSSKLPDWFEELGYDRPEEVVVNAHWGYTSCYVRVPEDFAPGFLAASSLPQNAGVTGPGRTRGASFWLQDGDRRWILTAQGSAGDYPPADEEGFFEFIRSVGCTEIDEAIKGLERTSPIKVWRNMQNRLRRYAELQNRPENVVIVGDSVAALNPVYGQGMTLAAAAAEDLRFELEAWAQHHRGGDLDGFARSFQERLVGNIMFCWSMSTGADYRVDGVIAPPRSEDATKTLAFLDRVEALSSEDPEIYLKFVETSQLSRTADWLQDPELRMRVERDWDRLGRLVGAQDELVDVDEVP